MRTQDEKRFYRPELDGLRFFAFLFVFVHHFWPTDRYARSERLRSFLRWTHDHGWVGVDLFFVLSGYLITTLLLREARRYGQISIRHFYLRRAIRIWPLYYLALVCALGIFPALHFTRVGPDWGSPDHARIGFQYGPTFAVFLGNVSTAIKGWTGSIHMDPLWSISMEEQYYLLWPLLVALLPRNQWTWPLALFTLFPPYVRWAFVKMETYHPMIFTNPLCRFDGFGMGGLVAVTLDHPRLQSFHHRFGSLALLGVPFVVLPFWLNADATHHDGHLVWMYSAIDLGFSCLLVALLTPHTVSNSFFRLRPLVWLGRISYGLYVWHGLGIALADVYIDPRTPPQTFISWCNRASVAIVITISVAALSYFAVERPFLRVKEKFSRVPSRPP